MVAALSSRVEPHPRRAVFTYSWSDFRGNPQEILARYYDAMLYMANWGGTQLMFRLPLALIDVERMQAYCQPRCVQEFFFLMGEFQTKVSQIRALYSRFWALQRRMNEAGL